MANPEHSEASSAVHAAEPGFQEGIDDVQKGQRMTEGAIEAVSAVPSRRDTPPAVPASAVAPLKEPAAQPIQSAQPVKQNALVSQVQPLGQVAAWSAPRDDNIEISDGEDEDQDDDDKDDVELVETALDPRSPRLGLSLPALNGAASGPAPASNKAPPFAFMVDRQVMMKIKDDQYIDIIQLVEAVIYKLAFQRDLSPEELLQDKPLPTKETQLDLNTYAEVLHYYVALMRHLNVTASSVTAMQNLNDRILQHPRRVDRLEALIRWHRFRRRTWHDSGHKFPLDELDEDEFAQILFAGLSDSQMADLVAHGAPGKDKNGLEASARVLSIASATNASKNGNGTNSPADSSMESNGKGKGKRKADDREDDHDDDASDNDDLWVSVARLRRLRKKQKQQLRKGQQDTRKQGSGQEGAGQQGTEQPVAEIETASEPTELQCPTAPKTPPSILVPEKAAVDLCIPLYIVTKDGPHILLQGQYFPIKELNISINGQSPAISKDKLDKLLARHRGVATRGPPSHKCTHIILGYSSGWARKSSAMAANVPFLTEGDIYVLKIVLSKQPYELLKPPGQNTKVTAVGKMATSDQTIKDVRSPPHMTLRSHTASSAPPASSVNSARSIALSAPPPSQSSANPQLKSSGSAGRMLQRFESPAEPQANSISSAGWLQPFAENAMDMDAANTGARAPAPPVRASARLLPSPPPPPPSVVASWLRPSPPTYKGDVKRVPLVTHAPVQSSSSSTGPSVNSAAASASPKPPSSATFSSFDPRLPTASGSPSAASASGPQSTSSTANQERMNVDEPSRAPDIGPALEHGAAQHKSDAVPAQSTAVKRET
ncbi:hypothetical protein OC835_004070 [Tilletia horrida]|nr:hypothetical protein OC835_004070 [Tilletia horrida]